MKSQLRDIKIVEYRKLPLASLGHVQYVQLVEEIAFLGNTLKSDYFQNARLLKQLTVFKSLGMQSYEISNTPIISGLVTARVPSGCLILNKFDSDEELVTAIIETKRMKKMEFRLANKLKLSDIMNIVIITFLVELTALGLEYVYGFTVTNLIKIIRSASKLSESTPYTTEQHLTQRGIIYGNSERDLHLTFCAYNNEAIMAA